MIQLSLMNSVSSRWPLGGMLGVRKKWKTAIAAGHLLVASVGGQTASFDLLDDYSADPTNIEPAISLALVDAEALLKEGYESVTLTIPEGVFYCPETIAIRGFDYEGRFVIQGAGRTKTTLVSTFRGLLPEYPAKHNDGIEINDSFNVELTGFHHTRDQLSTTQGHVVAVEDTAVDLEILAGFPCPVDLHRWNIRENGRFLLRFTAENKAAPRIDPSGPPQLPWTDVESLGGQLYRFHCKIPVDLEVGDLVAVKSKGDGQMVTVRGDSKNITISNMRYTHASRSTLEFWPDSEFEDRGNFVVRDVVINRPSYLVDGWAPCLSTPSDGIRINGNDLLVEDCYIEATGDDAIAFDGGNNHTARGNTLVSGFARGIVSHGSHGINGDTLIENNQIENIKQEPVSIEQINADYIELFEDDVRSFTVRENRIVDSGPFPSIMVGVDCNRAHIRIEDNWFERQDYYSNVVTIGSAALSLSVDNNTIASWAESSVLDENEAFLVIEDPVFSNSLTAVGQNSYASSAFVANKDSAQFDPSKAEVSVSFSESLQLPDAPSFETAPEPTFASVGTIPGQLGEETICKTTALASEPPTSYTVGATIEDFEDGVFDSNPPMIHRNLVSDPAFPSGSGRNGGTAMRIEVEPDSTGRFIYNPGDLSNGVGISFWIRSDLEREQALLLRLQSDSESAATIEGAVTTEWKRVDLLWSDLRQGANWNFGGDWETLSEKLVVQVDNDTVSGLDFVYFDDFSLLVPTGFPSIETSLEDFEDGDFDSDPPLIYRNLVSDPAFPSGSGLDGGVAMRMEVEPDSTGRVIYNPGDLSSGIGLSFWIRSEQEREQDLLVRLQIDSDSRTTIASAVTTEWKKIKLLWSDLTGGTTQGFNGNWDAISEKLVIQVAEDTVTGNDYVYFDEFTLILEEGQGAPIPPSITYTADRGGLIESLTLHGARPGVAYRIQYSENLASWKTIKEGQFSNEESVTCAIANKKAGFYRVGIFE